MPSVNNLFPAVFLALTAWIVSDIYFAYMPEGSAKGNFPVACAGLGLVIGWISVGKRVAEGYRTGIEAGLLGATLLVFWALFAFSFEEMISRSLDRRYTRGLGHAIADMFDIMAAYALRLLHVDIIMALVIGGAFSGLMGHWASRRWK